MKYQMVSGSYLAMVDVDKMKFKWSPKMALTGCAVFGMWSWLEKNAIYIIPSRASDSLAKHLSSEAYKPMTNEEKVNAEAAIEMNKMSRLAVKYKNLNLDEDLVNLVEFLCENDGIVLATVFHELYHKFQYTSSPFLYVINSGFFRLLGYALSTKIKFSIENDVREHVDNEVLWSSISSFLEIFRETLRNLDTLAGLEKDYNEIDQGISSLPKEECQRIKKAYKEAYDSNLKLKVGISTRSKYRLIEKLVDFFQK